MIADGFDATIHAPQRLRICAALADVEELEFGTVRDLLELSDSVLSKHVTTLVEAGYVKQRRAFKASRKRLWLSLTDAGRAAFAGHVSALRGIVGD